MREFREARDFGEDEMPLAVEADELPLEHAAVREGDSEMFVEEVGDKKRKQKMFSYSVYSQGE